jgi:addiction module HigA family antidote
MAKKLPPVHPGEILGEEFIVPLRLTPHAVPAALHVPCTRIERIAHEEKPVTADAALRLGKFFKTGAAFWMNMQARFDLETAEDVLAPQIRKIASYEAGSAVFALGLGRLGSGQIVQLHGSEYFVLGEVVALGYLDRLTGSYPALFCKPVDR